MPKGIPTAATRAQQRANQQAFVRRVHALIEHGDLDCDTVAEQLGMTTYNLRRYLLGHLPRMRSSETYDIRISMLDDMIEEHVGPGQSIILQVNEGIDAKDTQTKDTRPGEPIWVHRPTTSMSDYRELMMFSIGAITGSMATFVVMSTLL